MALLTLFPQKSSLSEQILCQEIFKKIKIIRDDVPIKGIVIQGGGAGIAVARGSDVEEVNNLLEPYLDIEKDFEFSKSQINLIQDQVKELDSKKELTAQNCEVALMFKQIDLSEKKKDPSPSGQSTPKTQEGKNATRKNKS